MNSNSSYSPEMPNLGQIWQFFGPCYLEIWRMTLKNNSTPVLSNIKQYVSFHRNMWIQTGITVRKRLKGVMTSVNLTFDLWPWPFAWKSLLSLVITPENFMMIRWLEHSQKGVHIWYKNQVKLDAPHSAPTYLYSHLLAVIFLDW